jgi:hypothetical protein
VSIIAPHLSREIREPKAQAGPTILALDPGPKQTGLVVFDGSAVLTADVLPNEAVLTLLQKPTQADRILAIEKIEAMGMAVGAETFETVHWSGRFYQAWLGAKVMRITRRQVKLYLCGNMRAKDPNIRQALIDLLGAPGTKKAPGPTYGVTSHAWSALAVAITAAAELAEAAGQASLIEEAA